MGRVVPVRSAVLCLALCCVACTPPAETPQQTAQAKAEPSVRSHTVKVTLKEGTNMALAVRPGSRDRVVSLQGQLFLLPAAGRPRPLTTAYFDAREPTFDPGGANLAFQGYRNGNWDIWTLPLSGGDPRALTSDGFDDREPQFDPAGGRVVFSSDRGGSYDIWAVDLKSGALERLTTTVGDAHSPSVLRGALAYVETAGGQSSLVVRADARKVLVEHKGAISGVQWSPDDRQLSYQLHSAEGAELRLISRNGGASRVLSQSGEDVFPFRATWLDGKTLAYTADGRVRRLDVTGGGSLDWPFSITVELTRHDYARRKRDYDGDSTRLALGLSSPVISNDGEQVYFSALGDLWRWQPGSRQLNKITNDPFAEYAPALRPDGKALAYVGDAAGRVALHVLELDSGQSRVLPVAARQVSLPSWSPDGERLAFFVDVPGNPLGGQLMVLDLATGAMEKVLEPMPAQPLSWSPDGRHIALTRLNRYSNRYREGMYELLVSDLVTGRSHSILPTPHQSVSHAVLTADGAMSYLQGALLHRLELDEDLHPLEATGTVTQELTDMPSWSANGAHLVYLSGARLKHLSSASGQVEDITPRLEWQMATPEQDYVVRAGRVFSGAGDAYLIDQDIHVSGNRIVAVTAQDPDMTADVDASDKTVIPGLFEMHAHMGENSETQGRIWLSYGITTVRDPGSNPYVAKERQEAWDSGRRSGPRTHVTGYLTDGNRVFYSMAEGIVSEQHLDRALARTESLQLDFVKTYVRLPDHWQRKVVDFAHGIGIPVSSHELYPAVAHGMDHVEHIGGTSRRGYQPKVSQLGYSYDDVVDLLSQSGMGITPTAVLPGFAVIVAEEPDWFETPQFSHFYGTELRELYQMMLPGTGWGAAAIARANGKLLRALTRTDALLVTGTDSPFVPYGAGLHAELRLYALAGLTPAQILHQATYKSALAAGVADELGTLAPGKLADFVIVDGDPLADIRDADNVVMTIKNGFRYPLEQLMRLPANGGAIQPQGDQHAQSGT